MFILARSFGKKTVDEPMSSERKGPKHDRILEAAVKVFARKGFHNSRIAEIAVEAGVASGTIYLYFRNKDDILISVFEESLDKIIREVERDLAGISDPRDRLRRFIRHHLRMLKEHRELAEVLQVELRQSSKFMKEYVPTRWVQYLDIIARILKDGQKKGLFRRDISLGIHKRAVFGALDEIALYWIRARQDEAFLEQAAEHLSRLILDGVTQGKTSSKVEENRGA
jgi:TetR/AcrR family transcriptional regulator, fatty acid metabolism regulator protein